MVRISKADITFASLLTLFMLVLSNLPYMAGYFVQGESDNFSGAIVDREDYAVHLAALQAGSRGEWSYQSKFTSEEIEGVYIKLTYILLGHLAAWLGIGCESFYHILRNSAFIFLCVVVYWVCGQVFQELPYRLLAFWITICGSGLGWFQSIVGILPNQQISPVDFWLMDGYLLFGSMVFPHFSISSIVLVGTFGLTLQIQNSSKPWTWISLAVLFIISAINQPFIIVLQSILLISGIIWALQKGFADSMQRLVFGVTILFIGALGLFYNLYIFSVNPFWNVFWQQNITLSPPFSYYLWGFGGLWIAFAFGIFCLFGRRKDKIQTRSENSCDLPKWGYANWLAIIWVLSALILSFLPINSQRRFMHAYTFPLGLLACWGVICVIKIIPYYVSRFWEKRIRLYFVLIMLVITSLGSLYLSFGFTLVVLEKSKPYFDPNSLIQAVDWLDKNATHRDVVLASDQTSLLIAERTGLRVFSGHPMETLHYWEKQQIVYEFFQGVYSEWELLSHQVDWVVVSPYDNSSINNLSTSIPALKLRYKNNGVEVYQVNP